MKKLLLFLLLTISSFGQNELIFYDDISSPMSILAVGDVAKVTLSWANAAVYDSVKIYRGTSTDPTTLVYTLAGATTSKIDTPLTAGTIYFYRVKGKIGSNLSSYSSNASDTVKYTAETEIWKNKVIAAGGTAAVATLNAMQVFFQQLADSSLRSKMLRINLICGDGLTSVGIPQILSDHKDSTTMGYTIDSLMNWVAGDYTELTGLGNAANTTKYIKTGFNPGTIGEIGLDNAGLGVYFLTNVAITATNGMVATNYFSLLIHQATNVSSARINATGGGNSASTTSLGYWDGNRTLSTHQDLYFNGALFNHIVRTSSAEANQANGCFFLATNLSGNPANYDTRKLGCYTIHLGLNATEERALNNIIEVFQDALGRGVE